MTFSHHKDIATTVGRLSGKNAIVTGAAGYVPRRKEQVGNTIRAPIPIYCLYNSLRYDLLTVLF